MVWILLDAFLFEVFDSLADGRIIEIDLWNDDGIQLCYDLVRSTNVLLSAHGFGCPSLFGSADWSFPCLFNLPE